MPCEKLLRTGDFAYRGVRCGKMLEEGGMMGIRQTFRNSAIVLGLALLAAGVTQVAVCGPEEGVCEPIWGGLILLAMGGITEFLWMRLDKTLNK